jgi:hypothetical protein
LLQLRFQVLLPLQVLCLAVVMSSLPQSCQGLLGDSGECCHLCHGDACRLACLPACLRLFRQLQAPHFLHLSLSPAVPAGGCLPSGLGRLGGAALLGLGALLPLVAVYQSEVRSRRRFQAARHQMGQLA